MSWNLEADIDFDDFHDAAQFAIAMLEHGRAFVGKLECSEFGPGFDLDIPVLDERTLDPSANHAAFLRQRLEQLRTADGFLELKLWVEISADKPLFRPVYLWLFSPAHIGASNYRRRCHASLEFGRCRSWNQSKTLANGEPADEYFLLRWLTAACSQAKPRSLYVLAEQTVSNPIDYHLIYHNRTQGYVDDLRELAQLSLYGGRGRYRDARRDYPALLEADPTRTMLFCGRSAMRIREIQRDLATKRELLQDLIDGREVDDQIVELAALNARNIELMNTTHGIGVYAEPLLRYYTGNLFFDMLDRLAEASPTRARRASTTALQRRAEALFRSDREVFDVFIGADRVADKLGLTPPTSAEDGGQDRANSQHHASAPNQAGSHDRAHRQAIPGQLVDMLVEDTDSLLTPVEIQAGPVTSLVGGPSAALSKFQYIATQLSPEVAEYIDCYRLLVDRQTTLEPGFKVSETGELWAPVDDQATPPVWDRVLIGARPVAISAADLASPDLEEFSSSS